MPRSRTFLVYLLRFLDHRNVAHLASIFSVEMNPYKRQQPTLTAFALLASKWTAAVDVNLYYPPSSRTFCRRRQRTPTHLAPPTYDAYSRLHPSVSLLSETWPSWYCRQVKSLTKATRRSVFQASSGTAVLAVSFLGSRMKTSTDCGRGLFSSVLTSETCRMNEGRAGRQPQTMPQVTSATLYLTYQLLVSS